MKDKNKEPTEKKKHAGGRPRAFTETQVFQQKIDDYFNSITISKPRFDKIVVGYEDEERKKPIYDEIPVLNNKGDQIIDTVYTEVPSIISLSHYIGITRETLNQYKNNVLFSDSIKRAKEKIEIYLETELFRQQGQVTGIIFNLKNNFDWKDKTETEMSGNLNLTIEDQLTKLLDGD